MTYFFETYGCQMNKAESSSFEQILIRKGFTKSDYAELADIVIINTCSVRATAEQRIFGRLGWYSALKKERNGFKPKKTRNQRPVTVPEKKLTIILVGCMAERLKTSIKKDYPVIDYVLGTFQRDNFEKITDAVLSGQTIAKLSESEYYNFSPLSYEENQFQSYVPIMHGCNNFCTYCIVPYVRGREVSRSVKDILLEIDVLSSKNVKEITLLGQNVNSYKCIETIDGEEKTTDFPELLQKIADHLKETKSSIEWVRFVSSHPKDLSMKLIEVIKKERVLCRHIHLPVQHGSSKILKAMNRKYTREDYLSLIKNIKKELPDVSLTTDILMGFPGETEEDVEQMLSLMKEVGYETAFMYYYNPREGTVACSMPCQVPVEEKKARLSRVIDLQLEITREQMKKRIGKVSKVLVETVSKDNKNEVLARTEQDEHVVFEADASLIGHFANVELLELTGNTFRGRIV